MKNTIVIAGLLALLVCGGCGHAEKSFKGDEFPDALRAKPDGAPAFTVSTERFGPGDVFELKVLNESELSGKFRVSSAGEVSIPLVGRVQVAKMTLAEVEDAITAALSEFIQEPQVSIFVEAFKARKIYVFGRVKEPGTIVFEDGMTLIEVITKAGGLHDLADAKATSITRVIEGKETKLVVSVPDIQKGKLRNVALLPGDIVFVPESVF